MSARPVFLRKTPASDFINSNIVNLGSDLDHKAKQTAAECEKAWSAVFAPNSPGIHIWRVEKFQVVPWTHGSSFHIGDSYIIFKDVSKKDEKAYNLHFWLGAESTLDEKGVAAYKTVELDDYLMRRNLNAPQYREECYRESDLFRSYFPKIEYLPGGIDTGFHHVDTTRLHEWVPKTYKMYDATILDKGNAVDVKISPTASRIDRIKLNIFISTISLHRTDFIVNYI